MLNLFSEILIKGKGVFLSRYFILPSSILYILEQLERKNSFLIFLFLKKKWTDYPSIPENLLIFKYIFNREYYNTRFISYFNEYPISDLSLFKYLLFKNYPLRHVSFVLSLESTIRKNNIKGMIFLLKLNFHQEYINLALAFLMSADYNAIEIFNYLLDYGIEKNGIVIKANPHSYNDDTLGSSCRYNFDRKTYICNLEFIKKLHSLGVNINNIKFFSKISGISYSPEKIELILWLIENGIDIHYNNGLFFKEVVTVKDLKTIARKYNLKISGTKTELIDRIAKYFYLS